MGLHLSSIVLCCRWDLVLLVLDIRHVLIKRSSKQQVEPGGGRSMLQVALAMRGGLFRALSRRLNVRSAAGGWTFS